MTARPARPAPIPLDPDLERFIGALARLAAKRQRQVVPESAKPQPR